MKIIIYLRPSSKNTPMSVKSTNILFRSIYDTSKLSNKNIKRIPLFIYYYSSNIWNFQFGTEYLKPFHMN